MQEQMQELWRSNGALGRRSECFHDGVSSVSMVISFPLVPAPSRWSASASPVLWREERRERSSHQRSSWGWREDLWCEDLLAVREDLLAGEVFSMILAVEAAAMAHCAASLSRHHTERERVIEAQTVTTQTAGLGRPEIEHCFWLCVLRERTLFLYMPDVCALVSR